MQMPKAIGPFHIIGIGGIGMSAIAEILVDLGYKVQGSDAKESANVARLRKRGIKVFIGQSAENLKDARFAVISSAIKLGNIELQAARAKAIPVIRRAEILAELMRMKRTVSVTGTHGKTTTTSLISHIFEQAPNDPTVITGGIIQSWDSNARLGHGDWMVVEADESDGTFTRLPTEIGVVTNIDPEHLDYFGTVEAMEAAFAAFYRQVPFYGVVITCVDHPVVRRMLARLKDEMSCHVLTYGVSADADLRLVNGRAVGAESAFDIEIGPRVAGGARKLIGVRMPVPGEHNSLFAIAAFAVAAHAGLPDEKILSAIATFSGVKRRFTATGTWNGVQFYDDYAHHPVELSAVLKAARAASRGKVVAIFQPHRYSRISSLYDEFCNCFGDADVVIVAPVYSAGEPVMAGVDQRSIAEGIARTGHPNVMHIGSERELVPLIAGIAKPGDLVLGLGAGTITDWSHGLPVWLSESRKQAGSAG